MKDRRSRESRNASGGTRPSSGFVIRYLKEDETQAHNELLDTGFGPLRAIYTKKPRPPRNPSGASSTVVAELDGRIVGAASYYFKEQQVRLFAMAVDPDYRRRGIARSLIQWVAENVCCEAHPDLGLYTIEETGNRHIFEGMGFRVVSRRVPEDAATPSGGPVHEVDMVYAPGRRA